MKIQHYTLVLHFTVQLPAYGVVMDTTPIEDRAERMVERMADDITIVESGVGIYEGAAVGWNQSCAVVVTVSADVTREKASELVADGPM